MPKLYRVILPVKDRVIWGPESRPGEPIKLANVVDPEGNEIMLTEYEGEP
ncbi:MAG: hypothetical protein HY731_12155 [Candidatus Tectomicrobia bacterium]|nr:hypothetical protein [Candidatus Tectomicrobia bacterium]